jgi:preprotein translocase subunit SecG
MIIGILLILIVVIQNPKGGGIASNFTGANQFMGVQKTNDFVEKATWTLAGALLVVALFGSFALSSGDGGGVQRSGLQNKIEAGDLTPTTPDANPGEAKPPAILDENGAPIEENQ